MILLKSGKSNCRSWIGILIILCCLTSLSTLTIAAPTGPVTRDDGLIIVKSDPPTDYNPNIQYITMILKTGYAHDPTDQAGLTDLTNELLSRIFFRSSALDVMYYTAADYSIFSFLVATPNFTKFCAELEAIVSQDALLLYDECNELIQYHKNQPRLPSEVAGKRLYELLYGPDHPYLAPFKTNYQNITINEVNNWFRKVYRPNNLIIASFTKMPTDFLRKPIGRDISEAIELRKIPPAQNSSTPDLKYSKIHDNLSAIYISIPAPRMGETGFWATVLLQQFLQKELWNQLREDAGLCYDLEVSYQYLFEPSAPNLTIAFQVLPNDTSVAIIKVMALLKKLAKEGVSENEAKQISQHEINRLTISDSSALRVINASTLEILFNQKWLRDSKEYLNQLNQLTPSDVTKILTTSLKNLKISVAGPAETYDALKDAIQEMKSVPAP